MTLQEDQFNWLRDSLEKLSKKVDQLLVDVAVLKVKASVWGLLGGMIPAAIILIYLIMKNRGAL